MKNFTGVSAPYDAPKDALNIDTEKMNLDECMRVLQADMFRQGCIKDNNTTTVVQTLINRNRMSAAEGYPKLEIDTMTPCKLNSSRLLEKDGLTLLRDS